jgi:hypothetical protein
MRDREGVAHVIPEQFDAYLRLHHPLRDGGRWAEVAPEYLRRGTSRDDYPSEPFPMEISGLHGDLGAGAVDRLVAILREHTTTPEVCHFGLWDGWGDLHPGSHSTVYLGEVDPAVRRRREQAEERRAQVVYSFVDACPVEPWWGARDMLLFDGPIEAVASIAGASALSERRGPQWWWPDDRAWFVASEIDHSWSFVGGPNEVLAELRESDFETVDVSPEDVW